MIRPKLRGSSESKDTTTNDEFKEAVMEAIKESDDKTVEIRPADKSKGWGLSKLLLLVGGAVGLSYWMRKSQNPTETLQKAASQTADRTKEVTEQAGETIEEGGETVADRVEEGSAKAGEQVQKTGEEAADKTEEAGEKAADKAEEASEKADEKMDESDSGRSSSLSNR